MRYEMTIGKRGPRLLGLPRDENSAFLWTELTLWPEHLLAQKRTLHFAAEFAATWFYQEVVKRFQNDFTHYATSSLRRARWCIIDMRT